MTIYSDLLIIGGGPAGLSAAINGASEGLKVRLLDNGTMLGGQARESSAVENYPGFPDGITGNELMSRIVRQARKFATGLTGPVNAARLHRGRSHLSVMCDDYTEFTAKAVLLALGLSYRRLDAENVGQFMGRGVYYGAPNNVQSKASGVIHVIVGGANSAGQAAMALARNPKATVKILVRRKLTDQMSEYLVSRIRAQPNIEVCEGCEVLSCLGDTCLRELEYTDNGTVRRTPAHNLCIFIGAIPRTLWLGGSGVELDEKRFIRADGFATSCKGVFSAGDVRSGNPTKRIASAVGEGVGALQAIHRFLA